MTSSKIEIDFKELTVGVADDLADNRVVLENALDDLGVTKIHAQPTGTALLSRLAINAHRIGPVHLILLDYHMPHADGYMVLSDFRNHALFRNTAIVLVTADTEKRREALEEGFDGFVGKPIRMDEFKKELEAAILFRQRTQAALAAGEDLPTRA